MNKKGFTLIDLMIVLAVIAFLIPAILAFMEDEKIAQKTGSLIKEFKQEATPEVVTETVTIDRSGVTCQDGKKTITIDGVVYHLGLIKNTWGDLESIDCQ
jgi:prepilin-type N-terminal cleavage/methylation domain-containing protein